MLARVVLLMVLVAGCSSTGDDDSPNPTTAPASTTTDAGEEATPTALDCRDPIATLEVPDAGYDVFGDAVALATSRTSPTALQTAATDDADPAGRLFAKSGLLVRTDARSDLIVPPEWHGKVAFRWGNTGESAATEHLVVGPCAGASAWIAFPGGYLVSEPACVDLIVRTSQGDQRVQVGVGAPCEGQAGPPEPSDA